MNTKRLNRLYTIVHYRRRNISRPEGWWKPVWHHEPKAVTVEMRIIAEDKRPFNPRSRYWRIARSRVWIRYNRSFRYLSKEIAWRLS